MRVGITGATGFIGGALVPTLARRGYDLVLVDNRSGPMIVEHPTRPALNLDLGSEPALRALSDCDVVVHLGAVSGVMACAHDPEGSARTNVDGSRRLVEMCRDRQIALAFASSLAVVGSPEKLPVTEETPARPTHEYARQKAEGERIVLKTGQGGVAPAAVLRMSNVYGNYEAEGKTIGKGNVLTLFLAQAREGRLTVNAPGTQRRDFIHLDDVLAHWEAILGWLRGKSSNPTAARFNVASGEGYSVIEIAEKVRTLWGRAHTRDPPLRIDIVPNPRAGIELVDPEFVVSREATERELGVRCRHHVEDFLRTAILG
ncbi:MAG: NAD(P)-dependent oxidoreductase [Thermoplasmata archaeon]|jgi:UDP-glucose 4-epimerase